MNVMFFDVKTINTIAELKQAYKRLVKENHPDLGGSEENMKKVNAEYEYLYKLVEAGLKPEEKENNKKYNDLNDGYREILQVIILLTDIDIELIGSWIWVSGKTYSHANLFRENNFKWSKTKKAWYWIPNTQQDDPENKKRYRGRYNLNQIRSMHGSTKIDKELNKKLSVA